MDEWSPYFTDFYDPLMAGSIDGTDQVPHDHGIVRAIQAKYKPNKGVQGDPRCTVFVSRLNFGTTEETLHQHFSEYGKIKKLRLVRDIVTGYSKGYAFIEYTEEREAKRAQRLASKLDIDDKMDILVDMECERVQKGWKPRRFGGGLGGKKGSGQLRFGGPDRPFRKPIFLNQGQQQGRTERQDSHPGSSSSRGRQGGQYSQREGRGGDRDRSRYRDRYQSSYDRRGTR